MKIDDSIHSKHAKDFEMIWDEVQKKKTGSEVLKGV